MSDKKLYLHRHEHFEICEWDGTLDYVTVLAVFSNAVVYKYMNGGPCHTVSRAYFKSFATKSIGSAPVPPAYWAERDKSERCSYFKSGQCWGYDCRGCST